MGDDPLNFWSLFTLLLAPFAGSFLALVVDRWPRGFFMGDLTKLGKWLQNNLQIDV